MNFKKKFGLLDTQHTVISMERKMRENYSNCTLADETDECWLKHSVCVSRLTSRTVGSILSFAPSKLLHMNALKIKSKALTAVCSTKVDIE